MSDNLMLGSTKWHLLRGAALLAIAGVGIAGLSPSTAGAQDVITPKLRFHDVRQHTREFHAYNRSISLNAEQRAAMHEALTGLPAPCCSDRTAATCCCPCNLAKA